MYLNTNVIGVQNIIIYNSFMTSDIKINITRPFGPAIGSANIPKTLIDKINNFIDNLIKDKNKSKELDFGKYLAGQVTQEISLPKEIIDGELLNFFVKITKTFVESLTTKKVTRFDLINCWVVRQFQNEYNPTHWHKGHISAAGYLKLPDNFGSSVHPEKQSNDGLLTLFGKIECVGCNHSINDHSADKKCKIENCSCKDKTI